MIITGAVCGTGAIGIRINGSVGVEISDGLLIGIALADR
jgi:hypothetical protein